MQLHATFLPVYRPNEQERQDPQLMARNVRQHMATATGLQLCDVDGKQLVAYYREQSGQVF